MYHSITIGNKNTWDDWHLIPTSKPLFTAPSVQENVIDVPGRSGSIDLTTALTGEPLYSNRVGSFEFVTVEGYDRPEILISEIMNYLHGKNYPAVLEDDPAFYYEGRFAVSSYRAGASYYAITIEYNVKPYKRELVGSLDDWLWDPFDFEIGIIRSYSNMEIRGERVVVIEGLSMKVRPTFIVTGEVSVVFKGKVYNLPEGTSKIGDIVIGRGNSMLTFVGSGTVSIDYRGGSL